MSTFNINFCVASTGMKFFETIDPDMPMGDIKEIVAERLGTTPDKLEFARAGRCLSDDLTPNFLSMRRLGGIIHVIIRK